MDPSVRHFMYQSTVDAWNAKHSISIDDEESIPNRNIHSQRRHTQTMCQPTNVASLDGGTRRVRGLSTESGDADADIISESSSVLHIDNQCKLRFHLNHQYRVALTKTIRDGGNVFCGSGQKKKMSTIDYESDDSSPKVPGPKAKLFNDIKQQKLSFLDSRNLETPEPVRSSSSVAIFKSTPLEIKP